MGTTWEHAQLEIQKFLKIKTGHLFSIAKLNFESICFLAFFDLRPFKLVHRHLKFLAFLHSENEVKICKIDKMAKNHFSRAEKGSRSAIFCTLKTAKTVHFCRFEGTKNGTLGARIKIPRPLLEIQTTPKTPNYAPWEPFLALEK